MAYSKNLGVRIAPIYKQGVLRNTDTRQSSMSFNHSNRKQRQVATPDPVCSAVKRQAEGLGNHLLFRGIQSFMCKPGIIEEECVCPISFLKDVQYVSCHIDYNVKSVPLRRTYDVVCYHYKKGVSVCNRIRDVAEEDIVLAICDADFAVLLGLELDVERIRAERRINIAVKRIEARVKSMTSPPPIFRDLCRGVRS